MKRVARAAVAELAERVRRVARAFRVVRELMPPPDARELMPPRFASLRAVREQCRAARDSPCRDTSPPPL